MQLAANTLYWVDTYTSYMYETKRLAYTACISLVMLNATEKYSYGASRITYM